jgi:hypothetical protein
MSDEYVKYQHVERIGNLETNGIEIGTCYIFPKIDGTNAHVWMEDGIIKAGSRRRELSLDADNAGFNVWVLDNEEILNNIFIYLPQGAHIFGEWLVPHSLKTYREEAWRRFYIFDILLPDGKHMPYDEYSVILDSVGYWDYILPIRILINPRLEDMEKCLEENKYLIEDGKGSGEGIVIKNYEYANKFGRQTWGKIVTAEFKEKHNREMGAPITQCTAYIEETIVAKYLTNEVIEKVYANIVSENNGWTSKFIPRLLNTVYYDFIRESSWDFIKENKNPTIDYKVLNRFVMQKVKKVKEELF